MTNFKYFFLDEIVTIKKKKDKLFINNITCAILLFILSIVFYFFIAEAMYIKVAENYLTILIVFISIVFGVFLVINAIYLVKSYRLKEMSIYSFIVIYLMILLTFSSIVSFLNISSDFYSVASEGAYYSNEYKKLAEYSIDTMIPEYKKQNREIFITGKNYRNFKLEYEDELVNSIKNGVISAVDLKRIYDEKLKDFPIGKRNDEDFRKYISDNMIIGNFELFLYSFIEDLFYCIQVFTTLGFGNLSPISMGGYIITILSLLYSQFLVIFGVALVVKKI